MNNIYKNCKLELNSESGYTVTDLTTGITYDVIVGMDASDRNLFTGMYFIVNEELEFVNYVYADTIEEVHEYVADWIDNGVFTK